MGTLSKNNQFPKARENTPGDQIVIGFSLTSDWSREWREFCGPFTEWSKEKTKQFGITFGTQLLF